MFHLPLANSPYVSVNSDLDPIVVTEIVLSSLRIADEALYFLASGQPRAHATFMLVLRAINWSTRDQSRAGSLK